MIELAWQFENLDKVSGSLGSVEKSLDSLKPLWEQFGKEFYAEETALFDAQPWAPLSPAYAKQKAELVGSKPILRFTDHLFQSFTRQGAESNVHRVNDLDAEFGSSDPKAMFHFFGTSRMPSRPPLAEPNEERYATIAGEYVGELMKSAGFN